MWLQRWLRLQGYDVTLVHNITDVNDKIYEAAPGRQRRARREATEWYLEDTGALRPRRGRPLQPKATETIDEIVAFDRGAHRARPRLRGRGRRLLPRRELPRVRAALGPAARRAGRGAGAEPAQGGSARLRALEGEQAGRGHLVGLALGPRPAGLAHRVLGDGREATSGRRSRSTAAGSTSSSRTTRTSSPSRARSATSSRASGCTTACSASPARRCRSRVGNVVTSAGGARPLGARGAARLLPDGALAQADRLLGGDAGRGGSARPSASARCSARRSRAGRPRRVGAVRRRARGRLQHARGARGHARVARPRAAARAGSASSGSSRSPRRRRRRRSSSRSPSGAAGARTQRDFAEADRLRAEIEAAGWEVRDVADARLPARPPARDARAGLRPARRARGAARAGGRCSSSGRPSGRSAPSALARRAAPRVQVKPERELTEAAGTRDHQGVVAWCEPYRYADAYELAARERPLLACLDQVTDPRNLGAVAAAQRARARPGSSSLRTARRA